MKKTVSLHTLGCKLNFSETSTIGKEFLKNGYSIVDFDSKADIYVFNTCTVTENAEKECRQLVRRALRNNPDAFVIVTGCYAQLRPEEIAKIEGVDAVLGSNEKFRIFSLLNDFTKKELSCIYVSPLDELNQFGKANSTEADSRTRAFFKIQDGCDYKCSFCTIPLARGKSRSMNPDEVISEFKALVDEGYKEIILTGVNVGDYGKNYSTDLYRLLLKIIDVEGDFRIRISSIEPNLLSDEIIDLTASSEKMCKHFHIPLQSGSADILKLMQRRYTVDDYRNVIEKVVDKIPECGIGIDVIVGFPGETEKHFQETYKFLTELPFSYLHVFTYSERPNTKAISLPGKVEVNERKKRNNMLRILSDKKKNAFYNSLIGSELEVLFEAENDNGFIKGFSSNYVRVAIPFDENLVNNFAKVKVKEVSDGLAISELKEMKNSFELRCL
ncbi:tRNA (N(6)-L-threonylcarbamoyladenosine(37)-C(2))-methylthiotransferase MtaB [Ignavibacterium sp.]|uniref:tRNA (N(6)-L-threonylcarbamoyladenosine(37)-C(2))- methylthiotransferase MtaB n=1 Tax=Ignavibacterium sp. TaxID=2651167 RepID=UPI00220B6E1F|nr:tRNA (N(6)-L-threonylcarbamoyladenosine(37)-C(2))-methylthiotransferase MtaB [Ignavibacterium sp.]BDQ01457.1 MAG: tRNA (N(6)-L-threonylcarbamoyladenosine(37)-C(2))-methylthiotransferase MtaB [Ignavibacterium sp.]